MQCWANCESQPCDPAHCLTRVPASQTMCFIFFSGLLGYPISCKAPSTSPSRRAFSGSALIDWFRRNNTYNDEVVPTTCALRLPPTFPAYYLAYVAAKRLQDGDMDQWPWACCGTACGRPVYSFYVRCDQCQGRAHPRCAELPFTTLAHLAEFKQLLGQWRCAGCTPVDQPAVREMQCCVADCPWTGRANVCFPPLLGGIAARRLVDDRFTCAAHAVRIFEEPEPEPVA